MPEVVAARRHALYRFFDGAGKLLYVGMTCNPSRRFAQHGEKEWWCAVKRIDIAEYENRAAVAAAEAEAIRAENPIHNIKGGGNGNLAQHTDEPDSFDGLIGRWFHSTRDWRDGEDRSLVAERVNGKPVVWQGQVLDYDEHARAFVVQLYSWVDGDESGQRLVTTDQMKEWAFYVSSLEMRCANGCPDSTDRRFRCGNPCEYLIRLGHGAVVVCGRCAKFWGGDDVYEIVYRDGHPVLGKKVRLKEDALA